MGMLAMVSVNLPAEQLLLAMKKLLELLAERVELVIQVVNV